MREIILRISASVLLLFSILFMPFWVYFVLAFLGMAYFHMYIEAVFLLLLSDFLYGVKEEYFFNVTFISFIVGLLLFIILEILKKKLRFHSK